MSDVFDAAKQGELDKVKQYIERDHVDINSKSSYGWTALIEASHWGHFEVVDYLVEKGAQLDLKNNNGYTALLCASFNNHNQIVNYLIKKGAKLDIQARDGFTALMWASDNGRFDVVNCLVEKGAKLDIKNNEGKTALDLAIQKNHKEIVEHLQSSLSTAVDSLSISMDRKAVIKSSSVVDSLSITMGISTDAFLTHDWGTDEAGRDNHARVSRVNAALKTHGINTWFDEERMEGSVREKMMEGIDNTKCLVVFVTDKYRDKINNKDGRDNCNFEYKYGFDILGPGKIVPVVMEDKMKNAKDWGKFLQATISDILYVVMTSDDPIVFEAQCAIIATRIKSLIGK